MEVKEEMKVLYIYPRLPESQTSQNSSEIVVYFAFPTRILQGCRFSSNLMNISGLPRRSNNFFLKREMRMTPV